MRISKKIFDNNLNWKVIAAEGELQASKSLSHAAKNVIDCPQALQVDNLQYIRNYINLLTAAEILTNFEQYL